jgi:hypothetical protein
MPSSLADRCHALSSLHPPPAALASLPNSTTSADEIILARPAFLVNENPTGFSPAEKQIDGNCTNYYSFSLDILDTCL